MSAACAPSVRASSQRDFDDIHADHSDAGRAQDLHQQLPDQSEADDAGGLAQLHLRLAETVQRDAADGGERSVLHRHAVRNGHRQVLRDEVELGVIAVADAGTSDALPDVKALGVRVRARRPHPSRHSRGA